MNDFDDLARALGIDLESHDEQLGRMLALADDDFLEDLVALRRAKGLTQQAVATRMKRDKSVVSRFENLGADPRLSTIRRYARAIGARVEHRVNDSEAGAHSFTQYIKAELPTRRVAERRGEDEQAVFHPLGSERLVHG